MRAPRSTTGRPAARRLSLVAVPAHSVRGNGDRDLEDTAPVKQRLAGRSAPWRPGDLPQLIAVDEASGWEAFARAAAASGLRTRQALALTLERRLLLGDAAEIGLAQSRVCARLDQAARSASASVPLTSAMARYVRTLTSRRALPAQEPRERSRVMIPIRLADRARRLGLERALDADAIEAAVSWEIAAAISGRTIAEWGLRELLVESAPATFGQTATS